MRIIKLKSIYILFTVCIFLASCTKESNVQSKATFWPNIVINGDEFQVVPVGSTSYSDASATVTVNGAAIPFETVSNVDATQVGAYTVTYTAINEDGIAASQTRTVIVVDAAALADDLSGTYQRGSGTPMSVWAKDPDKSYTYRSNNPGGVGSNPPFNAPFVIYNVAPGIVVVPLQTSGALAPFFATSGAVGGDPKVPFNVSATVGQVAYAWYMNGANFGPALRTFVKR